MGCQPRAGLGKLRQTSSGAIPEWEYVKQSRKQEVHGVCWKMSTEDARRAERRGSRHLEGRERLRGLLGGRRSRREWEREKWACVGPSVPDTAHLTLELRGRNSTNKTLRSHTEFRPYSKDNGKHYRLKHMQECAVWRGLGKHCTQRNKDQAVGNKGDLEPIPHQGLSVPLTSSSPLVLCPFTEGTCQQLTWANMSNNAVGCSDGIWRWMRKTWRFYQKQALLIHHWSRSLGGNGTSCPEAIQSGLWAMALHCETSNSINVHQCVTSWIGPGRVFVAEQIAGINTGHCTYSPRWPLSPEARW